MVTSFEDIYFLTTKGNKNDTSQERQYYFRVEKGIAILHDRLMHRNIIGKF
jgi:hypothetical protein